MLWAAVDGKGGLAMTSCDADLTEAVSLGPSFMSTSSLWDEDGRIPETQDCECATDDGELATSVTAIPADSCCRLVGHWALELSSRQRFKSRRPRGEKLIEGGRVCCASST